MDLQSVKYTILQKPLWSVLLFWLFTRLVCMLLYQHITIFPDSEGYIELAQYISNFSFNGYNGQRSPGYPLLIALSGNIIPIAIILQMAFGLLSAVLFYKTLLLLRFTTWGAVVTTALLNSLIHVIFYETAILTESFTLFLITAIFYLLFNGFFTGQSFKGTLLLGFVLGWLVVTKPFYIFFPFVIYGLYVIKNFSLRNIINKNIVILVFPLVSFLGWSYINKINTGHFVSTTFFGLNIAQNCVYFAEKAPPEYRQISDIYVKHRDEAIKTDRDVAMSIWYAYDDLTEATGLPFAELSAELGEYGKATISNNPWEYAQQVGRSWLAFWNIDIYWNYNHFAVPFANKVLYAIYLVQRVLLLGLKVVFIVLLPYHAWQFIKKRRLTPEVIICALVFATSLLQAMAAFGNNSRFSYPFEFFMVLVIMLTFRKYIPASVKSAE